MKTVRFNVKNDLSTTTTNHVLVFLKPVDPQSDYQYHSWINLNPSVGYTKPFDFNIDLSVAVGDIDGGFGPQVPINPGECFQAQNPNGQSPFIDSSNNIGGVTEAQVGVKNDCTTPDIQIVLTWSNRGNKIVTVGAQPPDIINVGKTVTFELEPSLYFMAADPTVVGPDFTLQDYSQATEYKLNPSVDVVNVTWTRESSAGKDVFTFTESESFASILDYVQTTDLVGRVKVQVWTRPEKGQGKLFGSGKGSVNNREKKATINEWVSQAALVTNEDYTLIINNKHYHVKCTNFQNIDPVATFSIVE